MFGNGRVKDGVACLLSEAEVNLKRPRPDREDWPGPCLSIHDSSLGAEEHVNEAQAIVYWSGKAL